MEHSPELGVQLCLTADGDISGDRILLECQGAGSVTFGPWAGSPSMPRPTLFEVTDVRDRQMERLNYHLADFEGDYVSMLCREIRVLDKVSMED